MVTVTKETYLKVQVLLAELLLLQLATFDLPVRCGGREVSQLRGHRPEPVLVTFDLLFLLGGAEAESADAM